MQTWVQQLKQTVQRFWQQLAAELEGGAALVTGPQRRDWSDVAAVAACVQAPPCHAFRMHRAVWLRLRPSMRPPAHSTAQLSSLCCRFRT